MMFLLSDSIIVLCNKLCMYICIVVQCTVNTYTVMSNKMLLIVLAVFQLGQADKGKANCHFN